LILRINTKGNNNIEEIMAIEDRRRTGINRISEDDTIRVIRPTSPEPKVVGKNCACCNKFFNYLKPQDKYCTTCKKLNK
jgi:hypothetical protein